MTIRPATPDDADALASIHIDAWRKAYRGIIPDAVLDGLVHDRRAEHFRQAIASGAEETYVAALAGAIIGFVTIGPYHDEDGGDWTGEIWGLYVAPPHWRRGAGRLLCSWAVQELTARGLRPIVLWVLADNLTARRFYETMGFSPDGAEKTVRIGTDMAALRYRYAEGRQPSG